MREKLLIVNEKIFNDETYNKILLLINKLNRV
jgi:hypothetical protein